MKIWNILKNSSCSFRICKKKNYFCIAKENAGYLCCKSLCPLLNRPYAAVTLLNDFPHLVVKNKTNFNENCIAWKKIKLNKNFFIALEQIECLLDKWPVYLIKCAKFKLTNIIQSNIFLNNIRKENKFTSFLYTKNKNLKTNSHIKFKKLDITTHLNQELYERYYRGLYTKKIETTLNYKKQKTYQYNIKEQDKIKKNYLNTIT